MSVKKIKGTVVSTKVPNMCVVKAGTSKSHKKYNKRYIAHTKFHAHYEGMEVKDGDMVTITETKPISKTKQWIVTEIDK